MPKRKKRKPTNSRFLTYVAWGLAIIALILSSLIAGYYLGYKGAKEEISKKIKDDEKKRLTMLERLEKASIKNISVNKRLQEVLKKEDKELKRQERLKKEAELKKLQKLKKQKALEKKRVLEKKQALKKVSKKNYINTAIHEYEDTKSIIPPPSPKRAIIKSYSKPKLAIIIDDISTKSHVKAIKKLHIPLTMSFLPPTKFRPNSARLAAMENIYMVHLPLEAKKFNAPEPKTLMVGDSSTKINARIREIKRAFPRVTYINNHTGSKFTSNELAMNRLVYALKKQNINFIDSRTTVNSKVSKVMKNFGLEYIARDIFLDHHPDKATIKKQIKKAIKVAKRYGTAIAIGHPHSNTIAALNESKQLLKNVELVYINRLY